MKVNQLYLTFVKHWFYMLKSFILQHGYLLDNTFQRKNTQLKNIAIEVFLMHPFYHSQRALWRHVQLRHGRHIKFMMVVSLLSFFTSDPFFPVEVLTVQELGPLRSLLMALSDYHPIIKSISFDDYLVQFLFVFFNTVFHIILMFSISKYSCTSYNVDIALYYMISNQLMLASYQCYMIAWGYNITVFSMVYDTMVINTPLYDTFKW